MMKSKTKKIIKWSLISLLSLIVAVVAFGFWFMSLIPKAEISRAELEKFTVSDIPYLSENVIPKRGKMLAVVTSTDQMGTSEKSTGYELTELARAYYVFQANGFEVDVASPKGGEPPVVIDKGDMKEFDYAFLNDSVAQLKTHHTLALSEVNPDDYEGVFFVGGKGAMFDFPGNPYIQKLISHYFETGKVVGAVCHGPAALVDVKLSNGNYLLANKEISSFTNAEELLLIPEAKDIFPFLLQDKLTENGAVFKEGAMYLNQVSRDKNLVTGQNPWSTWEVAESVIAGLGYTPKKRKITAEENTVTILGIYEQSGYVAAKKQIKSFCEDNVAIDRELLGIHSIMAVLQFAPGKMVNTIRLLSYSNRFL